MLASPIIQQVRAQVAPLLWTRLWRRSGYVYAAEMSRMVLTPLETMVRDQFGVSLPQQIKQAVETHSTLIGDGALLDFCITVLGCTHTLPEQW
jgi:hypothetical protein